MNSIVAGGLQAFLGLASGLAVGSGLVAFLVVLDVIPRLAQITGMTSRGGDLELAVVTGAVFWTCADLFEWRLGGPEWVLIGVGLLTGGFIGTVAAALTEVLNVFPILARRLRMEGQMQWLLAAMVLGIPFDMFELERLGSLGAKAPSGLAAYAYASREYGPSVYARPAVALESIRRAHGKARFDQAIAQYQHAKEV